MPISTNRPRMGLAILLGALLSLAGVGAGMAQTETPALSLTASGEVAAPPDMAVFDVSISAQERGAQAALAAAAAAAVRVFEVLDSAGIDGADRQTAGLSLHDVYERDDRGRPGARIGFLAAQSVRVRVRALETLGGLLDALTGAGITGIGGISFTVSDPAPLHDEARRRAVVEAARVAALMAEAAGHSLGQPLHIEVHGGPARPEGLRMMATAVSDAPMPISEGEVTIRATVSVRYALE